ncbi:DMT family transporter [Actinotignum urinale]|uniref:DMT family transporter n=1 Tax=Actinotignum urinale TaxID=190146 RepID=A0ABU5GC07_9ACTO|nr:DMT family transporter [Actinotignum urinale]MDY5133163.1 DMT family transporter [Actinotignum urinale]
MVINNQASASAKAAPALPHVSNAKAATVLMIGVVALAFSGIMVKEANFEPATNAFLRVAIGLVALLPFGWNEIRKGRKLDSYSIKMSLIAGIFLGIDFACWNFSIFFVGAGIASILLNLQVIIVPMLAWIFDKYHVPKSFIVLVPIFIVGIVMTGGVLNPMIGWEAGAAGPETAYGMRTAVLGTILGCSSGVCYSFYLYFSRKGGMKVEGAYAQPMIYTNISQLIAPVIFMIAIAPKPHYGFNLTHGTMRWVDGAWRLPTEYAADNWASLPDTALLGDKITAYNWWMIIALGVLGQAMAWTFVQYGSVVLDPTVSAGLLLLSPVTTVLITPFIQGEQNSWLQYVGVVVVLICVAYQNGLLQPLFGKKHKPDDDIEEMALEAVDRHTEENRERAAHKHDKHKNE